MTATRDVTIWCDGVDEHECGCWEVGHTASEVRSALARKGWLTALRSGRDLCPDHLGQAPSTHKIGDGAGWGA